MSKLNDLRSQHDDREDKLPRWAKDKLSYLRAKVEVLTEAAAEANPITPETLVVTDRYDEFPKPVKMSRRDDVTFFVRKYDAPDHFDVRLDGDDLLIYGSDSIQMHQQSGNVLRVSFVRGTFQDNAADRKEAYAKGWSSDEVRQGKHLGHIPNRSDVS